MKQTPEIVQLNEQKIIGTEIRTSNTAEQDETTAKIPAHWAEFQQQNQGSPSPVALYIDYESDFRGEYSHVIGFYADSKDTDDKNSKLFIIPAGRFLKFSATGKLPEIILQEWQRVWEYFSDETAQYRRNYQADLEIANSSGVELLIGVY